MEKKILFEKSVSCPFCNKTSVLHYPNPRLYVVANRESDQHVTAYTWLHEIKTDIIPHYYAVWQCPSCLFSDFKENIEDFKKSAKNQKLLSSFKLIRDNNNYNILKGFRRLSSKGYNSVGVIALHLSAIFIASLPENKKEIDNQKLGRLFLRLGWLFRELKPERKETEIKDNGESHDTENISRIFNSIEQLEHYYLSFSEELNRTRDASTDRAKKMNIESGSAQDPYHSIIENIADKLKVLRTSIELARQTVAVDKEGRLEFSAGNEKTQSGDISQKLLQLLPLWPEMVINEEKAMGMAVDAFDFSFREEESDRSNEQGMGVINLILRILIRVGDLEKALDYINQIYKMGFRDKQALQQRLNIGKQNKSLSSYDERMIIKKIGSVSMSISRAGESRKNIFQLIYDKKKLDIEKIIKENPKVTADQLTQLLIKSGIKDDMIPFLEEKGVIKIAEKKGWFGKKQ